MNEMILDSASETAGGITITVEQFRDGMIRFRGFAANGSSITSIRKFLSKLLEAAQA